MFMGPGVRFMKLPWQTASHQCFSWPGIGFTHPPLWALSVLIPSLIFGSVRDRLQSAYPAIVLHCFHNSGYFILAGVEGEDLCPPVCPSTVSCRDGGLIAPCRGTVIWIEQHIENVDLAVVCI
jgi:hypothetical protein